MKDNIVKLVSGGKPLRYNLSSEIEGRLKTNTFEGDNGSGDGYCSLYEWQDKNPNSEDREGLFVKINDGKLSICEAGDADGVVCSNFTTLSNTASAHWDGLYQKDDFGRVLCEEYKVYMSDKNSKLLFKNEKGDIYTVLPNKTLKDGVLFREAMPEDYYLVNIIANPKINPSYNPSLKYEPRILRPEWSSICLIGTPIVRAMENIRGEYVSVYNGKAVDSNNGKYKVLEKLSKDLIRIKI